MSLKKIVFPFYRIKRGENLRIVSRKTGVDSTTLLLLNNLSPKEIKNGVIIKLDDQTF